MVSTIMLMNASPSCSVMVDEINQSGRPSLQDVSMTTQLATKKEEEPPPHSYNLPPLTSPRLQKKKKKTTLRRSERLPSLPEIPQEPPPPMPRPTRFAGRPRSISEGSILTSPATRRKIFGAYWGDSKKSDTTTRSHRRSASSGIPGRSMTEIPPPSRIRSLLDMLPPKHEADYRHFTPQGASPSMAQKFVHVNALPFMDHLPPLPTPLQRLQSKTNGGVYPIKQTPKGILKKTGNQRFRPLHRSLSDPVRYNAERYIYGHELCPLPRAKTMEEHGCLAHLLVDSDIGNGTLVGGKVTLDKDLIESSIACTPPNTPQVLRSRTRHKMVDNGRPRHRPGSVRFDPRVTITEFQEPYQRAWYNAKDLETFKIKALALARVYLLRHPEEIKEYSTEQWDPVSGTMRKKGLFSLPALSGSVVPSESFATAKEKLLEDYYASG